MLDGSIGDRNFRCVAFRLLYCYQKIVSACGQGYVKAFRINTRTWRPRFVLDGVQLGHSQATRSSRFELEYAEILAQPIPSRCPIIDRDVCGGSPELYRLLIAHSIRHHAHLEPDR